MNTDPGDQNIPEIGEPGPMGFVRTAGLANLAVVLGSLIVAAWAACGIVSEPFNAMRGGGLAVMVVGTAVAAGKLFAIWQRFVVKKGQRRVLGVLKWVAAILISLFLFVEINDVADRRSIEITKEELSPLVGHVERELKRLKAVPEEILDELEGIGGSFGMVVYFRGATRFVLVVPGGSIDIDGSTIYYSPANRDWRLIHNDLVHTKYGKSYREAIDGLEAVRYMRSRGGWTKKGE